MSIVRDMFQSQRTDGSWFVDASATGWALLVWGIGVVVFFFITVFGVYKSALSPNFELGDVLKSFGFGFSALMGGGGLGTWLHSKSTP